MLLPVLALVLLLLVLVGDGERARVRARCRAHVTGSLSVSAGACACAKNSIQSWELGVGRRRQDRAWLVLVLVLGSGLSAGLGVVRVRCGATAGWTARISLGLVSRASERTEHNISVASPEFCVLFPSHLPSVLVHKGAEKNRRVEQEGSKGMEVKRGAGASAGACAKSSIRDGLRAVLMQRTC